MALLETLKSSIGLIKHRHTLFPILDSLVKILLRLSALLVCDWLWGIKTHLPLNKMAAILQMIFSNAFLWMKSFDSFKQKHCQFHSSIFPKQNYTLKFTPRAGLCSPNINLRLDPQGWCWILQCHFWWMETWLNFLPPGRSVLNIVVCLERQ